MKVNELTQEQQELLSTQFPAELEKEAAEHVEKMNELYSVGFEKIASDFADDIDAFEKEASEEEKKDESGEGDEHSKLDDEHKKEAAARGAFIARGYIDGLMKLGSERHGDELYYLYPAIEAKLASKKGKAAKGVFETAKGAVKGYNKKMKSDAKKAYTGLKSQSGKGKKNQLTTAQRFGHAGKALLRATPYGAAAGAAAAGAHKAMKKDEKED